MDMDCEIIQKYVVLQPLSPISSDLNIEMAEYVYTFFTLNIFLYLPVFN